MDASRLFHLREVVAAGLVFVHRFRLRGKEPERIKMRADNRAGLHKCVDLVVRQSHGYLFMSYFTSPVNHCPLMHAKTPEQGPSLRALVEYIQNLSDRPGSFYRQLVSIEQGYSLMTG